MRTSLVLVPVLSTFGCGVFSSTSDNAVQTGTITVIAFDRSGEPARLAEVVVQSPDGEVYTRGQLGDDGTAVLDSISDATVSIAISAPKTAAVIPDSGEITSFTHVPIDATLRVGGVNPAYGALFDVDIELPPFPGAPAYEVSIGCGESPVQSSQTFVLRVATGCAQRARTIVASAFTPGYSVAAVSVLRGIDLHSPGPIQMPGWQSLHAVSLDVTGNDPMSALYDGWLGVIADGSSYEFYGEVDRETGMATPQVPPRSWEATRYTQQLLYTGSDTRYTILERTSAGAPQSTTVAKVDFLVPPVRGTSSYGFEFDGTPDYRMLDLRYGCTSCFYGTRGRWQIYTPPAAEPITLPELPSDFPVLAPDGLYAHTVIGTIFDGSDFNGYADWLSSDPEPVPGATRRTALIVLREEHD